MSDKQTMLVEYLGDKPKKKDNVLNSSAVWNGKGDIQKMAVSIGRKLIQLHPMVWGECTDENAVVSPTEDKTSEIDEVVSYLKGLDDPKKVREYLKNSLKLTFPGNPKAETMIMKAREHMSLLADNESLANKDNEGTGSGEENTFNGVEITEQLQPLVAVAEAGNFSTDPEEAVSQAIDMLGGIDSGFYDPQSGMPSLDAVQLLVGLEFATAERIDTVMANRTDPDN